MGVSTQQIQTIPCCQHGRAWAALVCVTTTLLGSYPSAICAELPNHTPGELAERMRLGARSLQSLSVEQYLVGRNRPGEVKPVTYTIPGLGPVTLDPKDQTLFRDYRVFYKMKQHFLMEYSHIVYGGSAGTGVRYEREMAWNGEFFTWLQGNQGTIAPTPDGPYNGMSYLFLRLLYNPTQEQTFADYLVPPSIWRVEFEDPITFEGNPCYVLSLHLQPPGKHEGPTGSACWRLVVCPRFGFATVDYRTTFTSAAGAVTGRRWCAFRKFSEVATGMWLPLEYEQGDDEGAMDVGFRYESVNEPIDDAEFVLRFPPGTPVFDERKGTRYTVDE